MLKGFVSFISLLLFVSPLSAQQTVMVGAYHFPPFVEARMGKPVAGAVVDLVDALNQVQSEYRFTLVKTLPESRYDDFFSGHFDMLMFESIEWGWDKNLVVSTKPYLEGGEVYIALKTTGRDQSYFSDISDKTIVGIAGYHYGFADFNADPLFLKKHYKINFTQSNLGSIRMVLSGNRGDVAVVTKSFLNQYLKQHPEDRDSLLVSERWDQVYRHTIVLRKGIKPGVEELNRMLEVLEKKGELESIWKKNGIRE